MAYTKQTWAIGDIVTQEKMNHIEDGIAALETTVATPNVLSVQITKSGDNLVCNKTMQEILNAYTDGKHVLAQISDVDLNGENLSFTDNVSTHYAYLKHILHADYYYNEDHIDSYGLFFGFDAYATYQFEAVSLSDYPQWAPVD